MKVGLIPLTLIGALVAPPLTRVGPLRMVSADSAAVAALACEAGSAYAARDLPRLEDLSARDYVQTDVRGGVLTRAAYLDFVRARPSTLRIDCSDMEVRFYGEVAVVLGRWTYTVQRMDTALVTQTRWTSVWTRGTKNWERHVFQNTYIDADADRYALDKARAALSR
jgi:ketosteroid isomerase-like protein